MPAYIVLLYSVNMIWVMVHARQFVSNSTTVRIESECKGQTSVKVSEFKLSDPSCGAACLQQLNIFKHIGIIKIENQKFNHLEFVGSFPKAWILSLRRNNIRTLARSAFRGIPHIGTIYLDNNQIRNLPGGLFQGCNLRTLSVSNNHISTISNYTFSGLQRLMSLCLEHNFLTSLPQNAFGDAAKWLGRVELQYNYLRYIHPLALGNMAALSYLDLRFNLLVGLPPAVFVQTPLVELCLSHNRITWLYRRSFDGLRHLTSLSLYSNMLSSLQPFSFYNMLNVGVLDLQFNRLSVLHNFTLFGLLRV